MIADSVVIGYLSGGDTRLEFTKSLAAAQVYAVQNGIKLIGQLPHISGPRIASGRNHVVASFLATEGEWLLMVDDDMAFPADVIERMLGVADAETRLIIGGLTFGSGRDGLFPTLFRADERAGLVRLEGFPEEGLLEVDASGAACLLVHRSVFEKMKANFLDPWIWFEETQRNGHPVSEDITFCLRARELGFSIFVDCSIVFGHVKPRVIDVDEYYRWVDTHRFVIAGSGKCGLAYLSMVLTQAAVPCGHESMFLPTGARMFPWARGDASWMATPYLQMFKGFVVHAVRHPLSTVSSLVHSRFFDDDPQSRPHQQIYRGFAEYHLPEVFQEGLTPVERAMAWYVTWNQRIEDRAHARINVESVTGEQLLDVVRYSGAFHQTWEIQQAIDIVPKNLMATNPPQLGWDGLPEGVMKKQLRRKAKEYGYLG